MEPIELKYYLPEARQTLTAGEIYQDLVEVGVLPECPTTIPESAMDAIYYQVIGDTQAAERAYQNASTFKSPTGNPRLRQQWLRGVLDTL
jgi:hypothetical protein